MRKLGIYRSGDRCYTHDFYIQLGYHSHSVEEHRELCPDIDWIESNWLPDVFSRRYKRAAFQAHLRVSGGKDAIELRPRDFPNENND